jgi:hypothetical protein
MEEIVKQIEEFPDYYVSDLGNVYSVRVSPNRNPQGKFYKLSPWDKHPSGYLNIGMYNQSGVENKTYRRIHRLVWEAFNGPIPNGYVIDHKNADKKDNRLENLQLMTPKENVVKYHQIDKPKRNSENLNS